MYCIYSKGSLKTTLILLRYPVISTTPTFLVAEFWIVLRHFPVSTQRSFIAYRTHIYTGEFPLIYLDRVVFLGVKLTVVCGGVGIWVNCRKNFRRAFMYWVGIIWPNLATLKYLSQPTPLPYLLNILWGATEPKLQMILTWKEGYICLLKLPPQSQSKDHFVNLWLLTVPRNYISKVSRYIFLDIYKTHKYYTRHQNQFSVQHMSKTFEKRNTLISKAENFPYFVRFTC
jgi:hypothetical protein